MIVIVTVLTLLLLIFLVLLWKRRQFSKKKSHTIVIPLQVNEGVIATDCVYANEGCTEVKDVTLYFESDDCDVEVAEGPEELQEGV